MKKFLITLIIIGFVIGAHFLILKYFVFKDSSGKKTADEAANTQDETANTGGTEKIDPGKENIKDNISAELKPFNYDHTVWDKIAQLPDSAQTGTGILVDLDTREVLWAKNPRRGARIASMTKMMTALLAFEDEKNRDDLDFDTAINVTSSARKMGGSQISLDERESFPFGEIIKTVMIVSANDSAQLLADYLSDGNSYAFIERMNERAKELKLPMTKFYNPHGLSNEATPAEDNIASPEALIIIAEKLLEYPLAVQWASTRLDYLPRKNLKNPAIPKEPTMLRNHNKLVGVCPGVNGMKTGYTKRSGWCVTATCERGGKKMAAAVTGFKTAKERDSFVSKLFDWGYKQSALNGDGGAEDNFSSVPPMDIIPK
jgi:D-alanyl-D-alanine carboxypeptidase